MNQTPYTSANARFPRSNLILDYSVGEFQTLAAGGGVLYAITMVNAADTLLRYQLNRQYGVLHR